MSASITESAESVRGGRSFGASFTKSMGWSRNWSANDLRPEEKDEPEPRSPDEQLHFSSKRACLRGVERALAACADVTVRDQRGANALMMASASLGKDCTKVVNALLVAKAGVGLTEKDTHGWTALHHACRNGRAEIARLMIEAKGEPSEKTPDMKSCVTLAVMEGKLEMLQELLKHEACMKQVSERVASQPSAMHFAAQCGHVSIIQCLIDAKGMVNAKDSDHKMPLAWASEHGRLDCIKLLLRRAANLHALDKFKRTALFWACFKGHEDTARWLMKKGGKPYDEDQYGDSPAVIAEDRGLSHFKSDLKKRRAGEEQGGEGDG